MSMAFQVSMKRDEHQRAHEIRECVAVCQVADRDVCVEISLSGCVLYVFRKKTIRVIIYGETVNA